MKVKATVDKENFVVCDVKVSNGVGGVVCIELGVENGRRYYHNLLPNHAVRLWRCLMGETESCNVKYCSDSFLGSNLNDMTVDYNDNAEVSPLSHGKYRWFVTTPHVTFVLDADEALALAWTIKNCIASAIESKEAVKKELVMSDVWIATSLIIPTDPTKVADSSTVAAFSSKAKAEDGMREYLRVLVNRAVVNDNLDKSIDDILDKMFEDAVRSDDSIVYRYDGLSYIIIADLHKCKVDL